MEADTQAWLVRMEQAALERAVACAVYECPGLIDQAKALFIEDFVSCFSPRSPGRQRAIGCGLILPWGRVVKFAKALRFGDELLDVAKLSTRYRRAWSIVQHGVPDQVIDDILPTFRRVLSKTVSFPRHEYRQFFDEFGELGGACASGCFQWVVGTPASEAKLRDFALQTHRER